MHATDFTADQRFTYVEPGHYEVSYSPNIGELNVNLRDALFLGWLMRENHYDAISREPCRCSVCYEIFPSTSYQGITIHSTRCFHYVCGGCLAGVQKVTAENAVGIPCPVCRGLTASFITTSRCNQVIYKCYQGKCDFSCTSKKNLKKHRNTSEHKKSKKN